MPPIGGKNSFKSMRVMSSGYMEFVSANKASRSVRSSTPKRRATPGRNQTGSIAAFVTTEVPDSFKTTPSALRRPSRMASLHSGSSTCALVTAIVGRMSNPFFSHGANPSEMAWPQGSMVTMLSASAHAGYGPMRAAGVVSPSLGSCELSTVPDTTARARYTLSPPACAPMALRWCWWRVVASTGPRRAAPGAPQAIASGAGPKEPSCVVSCVTTPASSAAMTSGGSMTGYASDEGPSTEVDGSSSWRRRSGSASAMTAKPPTRWTAGVAGDAGASMSVRGDS
mmetsp:Transcript_23603/g.84239  ORF Transcript_23603/g.84239 Transcript_23603/m.84239 type:complete len:283 (-) Transcript_23603:1617-2465(-)